MIDGMISRDELKELFGIKENALCNWMKKGILPRPVSFGRRTYWFKEVVELVLQRMKDEQLEAVRSGAQRRSGARR